MPIFRHIETFDTIQQYPTLAYTHRESECTAIAPLRAILFTWYGATGAAKGSTIGKAPSRHAFEGTGIEKKLA